MGARVKRIVPKRVKEAFEAIRGRYDGTIVPMRGDFYRPHLSGKEVFWVECCGLTAMLFDEYQKLPSGAEIDMGRLAREKYGVSEGYVEWFIAGWDSSETNPEDWEIPDDPACVQGFKDGRAAAKLCGLEFEGD